MISTCLQVGPGTQRLHKIISIGGNVVRLAGLEHCYSSVMLSHYCRVL